MLIGGSGSDHKLVSVREDGHDGGQSEAGCVWQQYQHPGADGEQLREFGGDDDDGLASVGQFLGPLDDSALVPMSTPAIGSSRISTSGSRGSAEQDPFRPPGGMGSVIGSLFGSLLIGLINNGLILVALARKK